jgi:hypothetical protein
MKSNHLKRVPLYILSCIIFLFVGFFVGYKYSQFDYKDKCLDLGGGQNPEHHSICVIKEETVVARDDNTTYLCDEKGNKFISEDEAKKH